MPEISLLRNLPPASETEASHEVFVGLLAGIANHEAKLATTAIIATHPDTWFSETQLWNEVCTRQGGNPGWLPERRGPASYCRSSLGPVGLVTKGVVAGERGDVVAFKANDEQPESVHRGLALSGTLMEWSLQYPDISLQKVLGVTATKGAFRTPEVRYGILKELANNVGSPLTYADVARPLLSPAVDERNVYASIRELTDNGTIKTQLIDIAEDIVLEITGPYQYSGRGLHIDQMSDAGRITYQAIDLLWERGLKEITFQDFTTAVLEIDPKSNLPDLRQYWSYGSKIEYVNMPNFKPVTRKMHSPSIVALNPVHSEALLDLAKRLGEIEDPFADLTYQTRAARAIISEPAKMAALYAKARRFSANVTGQVESSEVVNDQILRIIVDAGQIATTGVFEAMRKNGRPLTKDRLRYYLSNLTKLGTLSLEKRRLDPTKEREYNFYSIPLVETPEEN